MKKYELKDGYNEPRPSANPPRGGSATIDAMLDKMSDLIRQRTAWADLAKLLLLRGHYDSTDKEIREAFKRCYPQDATPSAFSLQPSDTSSNDPLP